jgi:hypothetical protein
MSIEAMAKLRNSIPKSSKKLHMSNGTFFLLMGKQNTTERNYYNFSAQLACGTPVAFYTDEIFYCLEISCGIPHWQNFSA